MARPREKASNSTAPKRGDAIAAAAPSKMTSAGVQTGQTAVEKTAPRANAPQLLGALRAARTTAKAHEPNQATWPRMMRTGPSRRPHWRPARPADAQLRRSDTRGDGPGRVVDVVVEKRQPAAHRGPAGLNRYSRTTVADHEIAHLSHCLAIKFSETADGNCRHDLGVTIEIWGSSR